MAGFALNALASLQCPHGGQVQNTTASARAGKGASAGGGPLAVATDTFVVAGCPFQIPAVVPIPSPCVSVVWQVTDLRVTAGGVPTLSQTCVGLCFSAANIPQGPVVINSTQTKATTQ